MRKRQGGDELNPISNCKNGNGGIFVETLQNHKIPLEQEDLTF